MKIGDKIRARRMELGLSVDELAEKIGKNRSTVYRYENKEIEHLPTTILEPLVKALQVPPDYFMDWEDMPTKKEGEIEKIVNSATKREDLKIFFTNVTDMDPTPEQLEMARKIIEAVVFKDEPENKG